MSLHSARHPHKLRELLLIGTVRSFDFAVELRGAPFDVGLPDPEIFDMAMEFGLKFVTVVGPHLANAEWKLFDDKDVCVTG